MELTADWDRWPSSVAWTADSTRADRDRLMTDGRGPIFSVDPASGAVTQLTDDDFTYSDVRPRARRVIYALRSSYAVPPHPVRIDPDGTVTELPCVGKPELPGTLTEVTATAADGTPIRSWLTLPAGDEPRAAWCCGSTAVRWAAGTVGTGGGTRGCSPRRATPW